MVSAKESKRTDRDSPVESLFNSLHAVKEALLPPESGIQRAANDPQSHRSRVNNFFLFVPNHENNRRVNAVGVERKRSSLTRFPLKSSWAAVFRGESKEGSEKRESREKEDGLCANYLQFALTWSLFVNNFMQTIPSSFRNVNKCFQRQLSDRDDDSISSRGQFEGNAGNVRVAASSPSRVSSKRKHNWVDVNVGTAFRDKGGIKEGDALSLEILLGFVFDNLFQNLNKLGPRNQAKNDLKNTEQECIKATVRSDSSTASQSNHFEIIGSILKGRKSDVDRLLANLGFARIGGVPSPVGVTSEKDDCQDHKPGNREPESSSPPKVATGLHQIPLSNVERLRSSLSSISLTELVELVTQIERSSNDYPDKEKLFSVQNFFKFTQAEGRRFFEELDRDGDGQVTLEDLEIEMRKRRLPQRYAREFFCCTRSHLFAKSFGWKQFLLLMEQKEPTILRAYTALCLSKYGTLHKSQILLSLKNAGLPAVEENTVSMMRCLDAGMEGSISYGHFRNFMLLLPSERLEDDPRSLWSQATTVVSVAPPVEIPAESVLKSALAGGLACALSTCLMHPVETVKTRVQASTISLPELVSKLPQIGLQGLYRGCIPAILGQFIGFIFSANNHGLRTGIFEASKLLLINIAPAVPEIQVQSLASFGGTILGTAFRIPSEVVKQRLQAGIFDNVGEAIVGTFQQDGIKGFFRGTGATLCREVPFYVAGMGLYEESKKATQKLLRRDLEPWEAMMVGALSGGFAAIFTTPFDVVKTRMMTAPPGAQLTMTAIAFSILREDGPLGLFKGAVPRFFWIAPLGAMNLAGYELVKKAMDKIEYLGTTTNDKLLQKKPAKAG